MSVAMWRIAIGFTTRYQSAKCEMYQFARHPFLMSVVVEGPLAKVGLSAKFGVVVCKASMIDLLGGQSAKVCSSAKFCVLVFKANITCQSWNLLLSFVRCFRGISGMFWGVLKCWRGYIWHHCTMLSNCLLP